MKDFPQPEIYEKFFELMPWGLLLNKLLDIVEKEIAANSKILDIMCGPGYLLGEILKRRPDLELEGFDLNEGFIEYARSKYPSISFQVADTLSWSTKKKYDLIICTGGIHHLTNKSKDILLNEIPKYLTKEGFVILADPYLDNFSNEVERRIAAAKLGYEYLIATIKNGATDDVVEAALDIMYNDVLQFEYKTSIKNILPSLKNLFLDIKVIKVWPEYESEFGDYYIICKTPK